MLGLVLAVAAAVSFFFEAFDWELGPIDEPVAFGLGLLSLALVFGIKAVVVNLPWRRRVAE